jgi:3-oxoacyl-[acyl-carrier protein] reductase
MVFTSSIAYRRGSFDSLIYSIAKAGVVGLTRSMAKRVGSEGLVNAIAPGVIDTPMSQSYIRNNLSSLEKQIPVKRVGEPIDVANLIYFLISDNCTYVTGQTINIDGGMINS